MLESVFVVNMTRISVEKLSVTDFIKDYGRRVATPDGVALEYQYDEATGELWMWENGIHITLQKPVDQEAALLKLLAQAMFEAENHRNDAILVFINKEDALDFIQDGIENEEYEWEKILELAEKLRQI